MTRTCSSKDKSEASNCEDIPSRYSGNTKRSDSENRLDTLCVDKTTTAMIKIKKNHLENLDLDIQTFIDIA